jgi:hypothetical protein
MGGRWFEARGFSTCIFGRGLGTGRNACITFSLTDHHPPLGVSLHPILKTPPSQLRVPSQFNGRSIYTAAHENFGFAG